MQPTDPATTVFRYHALTTPLALNTTDTYACVADTSGNNDVSHYIYSGEINSALTWVGLRPPPKCPTQSAWHLGRLI